MKFRIGSLAIAATVLLATTSSSAQLSASTSVSPLPSGATLHSERSQAQVLLRDRTGQAPSTLDGVLMLTLGASLVAIQLRRRQKTFRAPLLRS